MGWKWDDNEIEKKKKKLSTNKNETKIIWCDFKFSFLFGVLQAVRA